MTRLRCADVAGFADTLPAVDEVLLAATGLDVLGLAARSAGLTRAAAAQALQGRSAAAVPVTSGLGRITGFAESVAGVLRHLGLSAWVTGEPDVAGFGEAVARRASLVFAADDHRFLALCPARAAVAENRRCTGRVFAEALSAAAERSGAGIAGQEALVIGLGPVGRSAAERLVELGARVLVVDTDAALSAAFVAAHPSAAEAADARAAARRAPYVVDATPARGILRERDLRPDAVVACPGVPGGLTAAAARRLGPHLIRDKLALGVAAMAVEALAVPATGQPLRTPLPSEPARPPSQGA